MKLLHIIASLDPAHGGPIEAVRCLGAELGRAGIEQHVLTLDQAGAAYLDEVGIPVVALGRSRDSRTNLVGKLRNWANYSPAALEWARSNIATFDVAVVHGLWNYSTRIASQTLPHSGVPYVLYPHGTLDPWFKKRYPLKHLAKQFLWLLNEGLLVRSAAAVLFTCEQERRLASQTFLPYRANERVVAFGTQGPPAEDQRQYDAFYALLPALGKRPYLLFLSRIHEKKGCDLLIRAFARIAGEKPELDLVMAGPGSPEIVTNLQNLAEAEGVAGRVHWPGMVSGAAKYGAYRGASAFVLPSHQENFGIVVAEALSCGCPVLISDQVNIWREVVEANAGIVGKDSVEGTLDSIRELFSYSPLERLEMAEAGRKLFREKFTIQAAGQALTEIVREISRPHIGSRNRQPDR